MQTEELEQFPWTTGENMSAGTPGYDGTQTGEENPTEDVAR